MEITNSIFPFNLKLLDNHPRLVPCSQKCIIPFEKFPRNVRPGSLSLCTVNDRQYVCFLYPDRNKFDQNFCAIDKCVCDSRSSTSSSPEHDEILTKVEVIAKPLPAFRKLSVKIRLNGCTFRNSQPLDFERLKSSAKIILELYHFTRNATIEMHETAKSVGIDSIEIISADGESPVGAVGKETEVTVDDVRFVGLSTVLGRGVPIAGVRNVIEQLDRIRDECTVRERFLNWGAAKPSFNALIVGPTGSGKTSICLNFIRENRGNVFEIQCGDVMRAVPGGTEEELRQVFRNAEHFVRSCRPKELTVILIENIELICPADSNASTDKAHVARISGQLISLLDDLHTKGIGILVLATTSNLELVDSAIRRPGRFENEILIHQPNENQRFEILSLLLHQENWLKNIDDEKKLADWLACRTPGFVGADLTLLVNSVAREISRFSINKDVENLYQLYRDYFQEGLKLIKPTSLRGTDVTVITSNQSFDHIGGMDGLKKSLSVSVLSPIRNPEAFHRFGLQPPKGILLYGPPGCAKTMIAKCLAKEANMTFISTSGAEVYSPYVGNAEKFILKIFNTARKNAPCLIFFDEIDALVGNRTTNSTSDVQTRVLSTLLTEMDGIGAKVQSLSSSCSNSILIVGATNRPDVIDSALMRPGRFDRLIHVPAPDRSSRLKIMQIFQNKMPFDENVNTEEIANRTENFSGADLCNLCNEAALQAMTKNFETSTINSEDFDYVLRKTKPSLSLSQIDWFFNFEKQHVCS